MLKVIKVNANNDYTLSVKLSCLMGVQGTLMLNPILIRVCLQS
jgi:hypothetical protein